MEYKLTLKKMAKHFALITSHKIRVAKLCFQIGLVWQGIVHDLSKYGPTEFFDSARYYTGTFSPIENSRAARGYSTAWLHHKGRNKHHYEYWLDFIEKGENPGIRPRKIPFNYMLEMTCDSIAAGQTYLGDRWTRVQPQEYWNLRKANLLLHPDSYNFLETAFKIISEKGEKGIKELRSLKAQYNDKI